MKIKFLRDCLLKVVESYDEKNAIPQIHDETFKKGEEVDGDRLSLFSGEEDDEETDYIYFQFGDGSCIYGLKKNLFEVTEEDQKKTK